MLVHPEHRIMLTKKLIYTGISRAKKKLFLIGTSEMLEFGIKNSMEPIRNSMLKKRLQEKFGVIEAQN